MKKRTIFIAISLIAGCRQVTPESSLRLLAEACTPRSDLPCSDLSVSLPYNLTFSGNEAGLVDKTGQGTGFTMADPPSSYLGSDAQLVPSSDARGYAPSHLTVSQGALRVAASQGIAARTVASGGNTQINALGVGFAATSGRVVTTTLTDLPTVSTSVKYEQGGVWFGLNEANFVKLVVLNSVADSTGAFDRIQLTYETNDATSRASEREKAVVLPAGSSVQLKLDLDPATGTVSGFYSTDGGATFSEIGTLTVDRSLFSESRSFGGVFASSRNSVAPTVFSFSEFSASSTAPELPSDATITVHNREGMLRGALAPGFYDDWLVFSRIGGGYYGGMQFHETNTLRIINTGQSANLNISSLSLSPAFSLPNGETTLSLAPGEYHDLQVRFVESSGSKGVRRGTLTITSDAVNAPTKAVQLNGMYMVTPEGSRELSPQQIVNAFGYTTYIPLPLKAESTSPLAGSEVRAKFWTRADAALPVYVRQLAAFHGCCSAQDYVQITGTGGGSFRHRNVDGQSALPRKAGTSEPADMLIQPSSARFEIRVAGYSTNSAGNLGVRLWPLRDRGGQRIENAYLVIQDFVQNGCGSGSANCDYNDNIYIVTNIKPTQ